MDMSVWYLVGAILVFFMQGGFAMVETGLTRAKNAGNIIMKNLMDFCIGTVVFSLLGYGIMMGEHVFFGLIGKPNLQLFTDFDGADWKSFVFQLVFCATAATIVSGSMAERTKFSSYCIYSAVISLVIYPIEAGWAWGGGWLSKLQFIDFAGSAVIHMVGGWTALIGAWLVGPRIGKYTKDKDGKTKVNAIPGHSMTLAALGVFMLWFAWYGFNAAAAADVTEMAQILGTTTIAPSVATVVCMIYTWLRTGKPDVSMCLNASLAGLVAVTAGCASVDAIGAAVIGAVSGVLVVESVNFIDQKVKIDDPVGAFSVHGVHGLWGTIAVGLFACNEKYGTKGLFYGGGFRQLGVQCLGVVCILAWTIVTMFLVFKLIEKTNGLRVKPEEEIEGLDIAEHGLVSAYADFVTPQNLSVYSLGASTIPTDAVAPAGGAVPPEVAIPAYGRKSDSKPGEKISKVEIIMNMNRFEPLKNALEEIGVTGMTVTNVMGCGIQKGQSRYYRGVPVEIQLLPKVQVDIVVSKVPVSQVISTARKVLYTGNIGDGKIFVFDVENVVKVRTGEEGYDALQ